MKNKILTLFLLIIFILNTFSGAYAIETSIIGNSYGSVGDIAKTVYVSISGDDSNDGVTPDTAKKTIQNAIDSAKSGDTVQVASGVYQENVHINKDIILIGHDPGSTFVDGMNTGSCMSILKGFNVTIKGLTLKNGKALNGGGIHNEGKLSVQNSLITINTAVWCGGGIYNYDSDLELQNTTINNNTAKDGGGIYNWIGELTYDKSSKIENNNPNDIITGTFIYVSNNGDDSNDGVTPDTAKKTIQNAIDSAPSHSRIKLDPGFYQENIQITKSIELMGADQSTTIIDGSQENNCINIQKGKEVTISGITITNGLSDIGGGILNNGMLFLKDSTITSNTARNGGGIYNKGNLTIQDSIITNNKANENGGGVYNENRGILNLPGTNITENSAASGGGIFDIGMLNNYANLVLANNAADDIAPITKTVIHITPYINGTLILSAPFPEDTENIIVSPKNGQIVENSKKKNYFYYTANNKNVTNDSFIVKTKTGYSTININGENPQPKKSTWKKIGKILLIIITILILIGFIVFGV